MLAFAALAACGAVTAAARGLGDGAARFFSPLLCLYAPLWIAERALSTYWAFYWRIAYGGYPFGDKLVAKGTGRAWRVGGRTGNVAAAAPNTSSEQ